MPCFSQVSWEEFKVVLNSWGLPTVIEFSNRAMLSFNSSSTDTYAMKMSTPLCICLDCTLLRIWSFPFLFFFSNISFYEKILKQNCWPEVWRAHTAKRKIMPVGISFPPVRKLITDLFPSMVIKIHLLHPMDVRWKTGASRFFWSQLVLDFLKKIWVT